MTIQNFDQFAARHNFNTIPTSLDDLRTLFSTDMQEGLRSLENQVSVDRYGHASAAGDLAQHGLDINLTHSLNTGGDGAAEGISDLTRSERSQIGRSKRAIDRISAAT